MSFVDTLTSKAGPLPVWAYGVMGGGVIGLFTWRSRSKKAKEAGTAEDSVSTNSVAPPEDSGLVDTQGWGSSPYPQSAAFGTPMVSDLTDAGLTTVPVNPQTGNPYALDVSNPINPATGQPFAIDVALGEQRNAFLESEIDRLRNENAQIVNAPPAATPGPDIVAPTAPSPVTTTPAPAPRPSSTIPPRGTVIWSGASRPVEATINNFIQSKYGRPISWRTVDRGAGKTPRFQVVTQ